MQYIKDATLYVYVTALIVGIYIFHMMLKESNFQNAFQRFICICLLFQESNFVWH